MGSFFTMKLDQYISLPALVLLSTSVTQISANYKPKNLNQLVQICAEPDCIDKDPWCSRISRKNSGNRDYFRKWSLSSCAKRMDHKLNDLCCGSCCELMRSEGIFDVGAVMPTVPVPEVVTKPVLEPTTKKVVTTASTEIEVIDSSTEKKVEETTTVEDSTTEKLTTEKLTTERSTTKKMTTKQSEETTITDEVTTGAQITTELITEKPRETADPVGSGESGDFDDDDGSTSNDELSPMVPNKIIQEFNETVVDAETDDETDDAKFTSTVDYLLTEGVSKPKNPRIARQERQSEASCDISHSDVEKSGFFFNKQFPNLSFRIINKQNSNLNRNESVLYESKASREQNRSFLLPSYELSENDFSELSDVQIECGMVNFWIMIRL